MTPFAYKRARHPAEAIQMHEGQTSRFLGGGTNLVDLMRETIERPTLLVDVSSLSHDIREDASGSLVIGAAAVNTAVAEHRIVRERYPLLARAILAGASGQIRNMATVGGNLMQRTRCAYFYDNDGARCNKRTPAQGCDARDGFNRNHAILGASDACIAVHPSDMCVALAALDTTVRVQGPDGEREVPFTQLHRLPEQSPNQDTTLGPRDLITEIVLPALPVAAHSTYRKVRDRASYAFALVSVAAALNVRDGKVADVRIALGGVAHKPWRATVAEAALRTQAATDEAFRTAADAELAASVAQRDNGFKIELARRLIVSTLRSLAGEQS